MGALEMEFLYGSSGDGVSPWELWRWSFFMGALEMECLHGSSGDGVSPWELWRWSVSMGALEMECLHGSSVKGTWRVLLPGDPEGYLEKSLWMGISS
jgi:hypothetical protein